MNPELDLVLQRDIPVPPDAVWRAWTEPELLKQWFTPRPWRTVDAEIDPQPGGVFRTEMAGPNGEAGGGGTGCILQAVPGQRLVWTGALLPGFRPAPDAGDMVFSAVIDMQAIPGGTRYTATVMHSTKQARDTHDEMGFQAGWGAALDQLVELLQV